jgi:hypothetical protein
MRLKRVDLPTFGRPTSTMVGFTLGWERQEPFWSGEDSYFFTEIA